MTAASPGGGRLSELVGRLGLVAWFLHLEDPGFPEAPWPGVRRLGPFDTQEEAEAQAVSDASLGMGVMAVFDEESSEALAYPVSDEQIEHYKRLVQEAPSEEAHATFREQLGGLTEQRALASRSKPVVSAAQIRRRGEAEAKRRVKAAARVASERDGLLAGLMGSELFEQARAEGLV